MSNSNGFRVQVTVELGHHASTRKKPTPEGFTHDWTVFVRGPDGSKIHYFIEKVVFHLHETFAKSKRVVKEPPYSVSESGYAGFIINIDIYFKNKENPKKVSINYDLFLPAEGFDPINHTHCEKLTFQNPTEEFRSKLLKAGGVEYPIGSAPPNQPFTEVFGPPIVTDSKKPQNQLTSGKMAIPRENPIISSQFPIVGITEAVEKDKGSKYKTSSSAPDVIKSSTSHCIPSTTPGAPPIASKDIKPSKEKTSSKEAVAQKRMLKSSPEQSSAKKLKRDNSAESKDKEKHKSHKDKKHSDTADSKPSSVKSESSKNKSKEKSEHVKMKDGSKKHKSDKDQLSDSKPSNHSSSKSHSDVKKKPEKLSPLRDSPKTDCGKSSDSLKRKLEKISPVQNSPLAKECSKSVVEVKKKPEKVSPVQDSSDDSSSDSDSLPSSKSVSGSCSSPLSSLSEDDEDVQMVMSIIAEDSDAPPLSPDVSRKHRSDSEPKDRKPQAVKSESKPSKPHHSSHTTSASANSSSKKSSQTKSSAKPETSSKPDPSSKSESSKSGSKSDVSKQKDSKIKKEKMPTTPSKLSSKSKDVRDSKPQTESKPAKCLNGDIPDKAPNGEKIVTLLEMQRTIMKLRDRKVLQQVVNLISKTGLFNITEDTFDFDLCKLDIGTVNKIRTAISQM